MRGIGTWITTQHVREHFAVLEATEQPWRHDRASQRREQVGAEEPELAGEDSRAELASGVDASAGDGAKPGNRCADEAADQPRHPWSQPGHRQKGADEHDNHSHAGTLDEEDHAVRPTWRRREGGINNRRLGQSGSPHSTRQEHAQK